MSGNHFSIAAERMAEAREGIAREHAMLDAAGPSVYVNAAWVGSAIENDLLLLSQEALEIGSGQPSRQQQAAAVARHSTADELESERRRIARELHDSLGQSLTLLKLGLDELSRALPGSGKEIGDRLAALKGLADDACTEAHRIAWEIRPASLDDLGLEAAIRHLVETWSERSDMRFDLRLALGERRLSPAMEITLYRVLQEAITNIARHARATRVALLLEAREKEVSMIVEDNGQGFSPEGLEDKPSKHLGLLGIRERLSLVSGAIEVESAPGKGCTLYIRAPL